tara:strand:- start:686 stop:919 length:234 start_codon:yes stop_codon:yes gene_type:complete
MWWMIGALLILIPAEDYLIIWKAGKSYRELKKTHRLDPIVSPMLKLAEPHFRPKPFHLALPAIGMFILACETMDAIQ